MNKENNVIILYGVSSSTTIGKISIIPLSLVTAILNL